MSNKIIGKDAEGNNIIQFDSPIYGRDQLVEGVNVGGLFKFKTLGTYPVDDPWIMLVYGRSKAGKTYFIGTAGPRLLYVNIGLGVRTLQSPAFKERYPEAAEGIIVVDITGNKPGSPTQAFDALVKSVNYALKNFPDQFDTIAIDEASAVSRVAMDTAMELVTSQRTGGKGRKDSLEHFVSPEIQDYKVEMEMIEWLFENLIPECKRARKNLIIGAHEKQVFGRPQKIGDEAPLLKTLPGFTGKSFPDRVPAYFDDVWHFEAVGGEGNRVYRARTAGTESRIGGSRNGGVFNTIEPDPNYLSMLARVKAGTPLPKRK